jgi:hypothetical protein
MSQFASRLRRDVRKKILILEIPHVFLRLEFLSSLVLNKLNHFETGSCYWREQRIVYFGDRYSEAGLGKDIQK